MMRLFQILCAIGLLSFFESQAVSLMLSLQAIQSNFLNASDPTGGNNGLPIVGLTIPTRLIVHPHKKETGITLSIEPFSFTLTEEGFLISQDVLPTAFAPTNARWITFKADTKVFGHVFRDGSIRFSGPNNTPLKAGTYTLHASRVSFSQKKFPTKANGFFLKDGHLVRSYNFPISKGLSNTTGLQVNANRDYFEYYGLAFFKGKIYTSTTDNSFNNSMTPIAVFNKLDAHGKHLIPQVNIVPPGFANAPSPTMGFHRFGEETLAVNPIDPRRLATTFLTFHTPQPRVPNTYLALSNDGGLTWRVVDPLANVGPLPTPPGFEISFGGDRVCIFDAFGNLFYTQLVIFESTANPNLFTAFEYVLLSSDGGDTWELIDFITGVNPKTFGLDYPIIATGPGPHESQVTWLMLKQDISFDEIAGFGASLPLMIAAYQTTAKGIVAKKKYMEVPGSKNGGYGTISVGPRGEVLIVGTAVNNALGTLPFGNTSIWFSRNKEGLNGTFEPIKLIANSNSGYLNLYSPQINRGTWSHPNAIIDRNGRWYLVYVDQPTPHISQPNPNIYLVYSDNQGKHWSTPVRLNNDVHNTTFHFMPQLAIDPQTNDLVVTWLDSREDELDVSTRLWGTVIKNGTLPVLCGKIV